VKFFSFRAYIIVSAVDTGKDLQVAAVCERCQETRSGLVGGASVVLERKLGW
jgi:hypothetical protein